MNKDSPNLLKRIYKVMINNEELTFTFNFREIIKDRRYLRNNSSQVFLEFNLWSSPVHFICDDYITNFLLITTHYVWGQTGHNNTSDNCKLLPTDSLTLHYWLTGVTTPVTQSLWLSSASDQEQGLLLLTQAPAPDPISWPLPGKNDYNN